MTKTIEEAAKRFADNAYYPAPDYGWYESDDEQMKECLAETFKAGSKHVYQLPLSSRLTAEEKEQIKKLYCAAEASKSDYSRGYSDAIKRIFGKELFERKEEE